VRTFDYPQNLLRLAFQYGLHPAGNRERHTLLDRDTESQISDWIQQNAESSTPVKRQAIKQCCTSQFQTPLTRGWVTLFVLRFSQKIIHTKSIFQEDQRLELLPMFLHRRVQNLNEHIQGCTTQLVFNLVEVGISDWEDRKTRNAVGPAIVHGIS
jgi:hypothetical protein